MELLSPAFKTVMEYPLLSYLLVGGIVLWAILIYPLADGQRKTNSNVSVW